MKIRIAIAGAAGRMGRALAEAADPETFELAGGTEQSDASAIGQDIAALAGRRAVGVTVSDRVAVSAAKADVWLDFTSPKATLEALDALKDTPVKAAIVGTTGFTKDEDAALVAQGDRFAIVKAGNFSLGVNLLTALVEQAAARLDESWDIEISETHHRNKVDAPSGTALMLGEAAASGRGVPLPDVRTAPYYGLTGERERGKIGFAVRRAGGFVGEHEALFASELEAVSLSHTALDRSIFAHGALHAAKWAMGQQPGFYSMRDVLGL